MCWNSYRREKMIENLEERMQKSVSKIKEDLAAVRTGRANPDILSKIQVDYYGSKVPLKQLANITVPESMLLMLNIFDKGAVKGIEKAITISDLNLNPQTEGTVIRLRLPELTEERRKELVKLVKKQVEEGKVSIRNIRRDFMDALKTQEKNKEISEDENKTMHTEAQKITDKYVAMMDVLGEEKEVEIMKI
jgi:ribosome recycling factor